MLWFKRKQINVTFTARDQENAGSYMEPENCLLATALKRMGYKNVHAGGFGVNIDGKYYRMKAGFKDGCVVHDLTTGFRKLPFSLTLIKQ